MISKPRVPSLTPFLSTLSLRRATICKSRCRSWTGISIHALLAESDGGRHPKYQHQQNFYPRSPCGERLRIFTNGKQLVHISIHALLAESDPLVNMRNTLSPVFLSTLSLRRATAEIVSRSLMFCQFLSTLSLRRATSSFCQSDSQRGHFYPRSPCGERQVVAYFFAPHDIFLSTLSLRRATVSPIRVSAGYPISIHALLAESD